MAIKVHPQAYHLDYAGDDEQVALLFRNIDEMLQDLFSDLSRVATAVNTATTALSTTSVAIGPRGPQGVPGTDGEDGVDGTPGPQGLQGKQGLLGPSIPGTDPDEVSDPGWPWPAK